MAVSGANAVTATSTNAGTLTATVAGGVGAGLAINFTNLAGTAGMTLNGAGNANGLVLTSSAQSDTVTGGGGTDTLVVSLAPTH